jgi:hypothetical protein
VRTGAGDGDANIMPFVSASRMLEGLPPQNEDGASGHAVYSPWRLYSEQHAGALDFARGYHIEIGGGRRMPGVETMSGIEWLTGGSYGKRFKEDARRYYGSFVSFDGRGEMIPNEQSYCDIDPTVKDKWGISRPALPLAVVAA